MKIVILEGGRGGGKSTIAQKLRQMQKETTLINFTGFHDDGDVGLKKSSDYYKSWIHLIYSMCQHDSIMVFDRFYFSEAVFSKLYKEYDFTSNFSELNTQLMTLATLLNVKIDIFHLTVEDEEELKNRLVRDKIPFGKVEESVAETLKQQEEYKKMFDGFKEITKPIRNIKVHNIDTTGLTNDDVYNKVVKLSGTTFN